MVIEPNTQTLYIFAGQRDDKYLSDMYSYDIATNTATELYSNFSTAGGPEACFTQRAVLDPELREFYVLCGLTRSQHAGALTTLAAEAPNWMFSYSSCPGTWTQILPQPPAHQGPFTNDGDVVHAEEPQPRYAHQVVYNPHTKTLFMHGGNAGFAGEMERAGGGRGHEGRLDDLWQMTLARFREMCEDSAPIKALSFLQTDVSAVVDHNDPSETDTFRSLLTYLLSPPSPSMKPTSPEAHDTSRKDQQITTAPDMDERWTDQLIEDESSDDTMSMHAVDPRALCAVQDPLEREVMEVTDSSLPQGKLTGVRFAQRNEVFENLLGFVSAEQKQPTAIIPAVAMFPPIARTILYSDLSDELLASVAGNAPRKVKEAPLKWLAIFRSRDNSFANAVAQRIRVAEVSVVKNPEDPRRKEGRVVCELEVTKGVC
ncbi:hypothetical protein H0H81_007640 [Sphagnurus paluster]|uniref:Uncharacterized protein n=1 Tax=Sphagnurus paluster TaxID=117069 RepID=A0A9P7G202_9AGAR|nr:hypothetical protein H0H81_007640 [Sphagnurus paluster]